MGNVGVWNGFRLMVNTDDHEPAHIHVIKDGKTIFVRLHDLEVYDRKGSPTKSEERKARLVVMEHIAECWEKWNATHPPVLVPLRKPRIRK